MKFKLQSNFSLLADQENAVRNLCQNYNNKKNQQVLLGVTGSGKTFTIANVIERLQLPTLVISHNKTLAAQLYQEFKNFFPANAVSYFVSYYDYYQPEAYIPSTDTYIEKDADINEVIDKLRLAATTNLLTRPDNIVVSSVSCIYNIGSPQEYGNFILDLKVNEKTDRNQLFNRLIELQYERSDFGFNRGTFRVRGNTIDIYPAYQDEAVRVIFDNEKIANLTLINPVSGESSNAIKHFVLYPAKHFIADLAKSESVFTEINKDLKIQVEKLKKQGKNIEAERLDKRVTYDLSMIAEVGYVKGIENYSRYFDGRAPGEAPYSLIEYFRKSYGDNWLLVVDESHMTFPQIRGMYFGDLSRKQTLIDYGFRLPAALDNRPLKFDEFMRRVSNFIAVSATPADWELSITNKTIVEQLVRPTGIPDPLVSIRPVTTQVKDIINEVKIRARKKQRTLITTLTKKSAEDLSEFMTEQGVNVCYLHSDIKTLERTDILDNLRRGKYDCIVGVNLLREGLDLPEVSLVAILDADKEGFLRSDVALIQTMGRAARHVNGEVILYADNVTGSIQRALDEVKRRREYQLKYNIDNHITPVSINKPFMERMYIEEEVIAPELNEDITSLTPYDKKKLVKLLRTQMLEFAKDLNFEAAIKVRDKIKSITP